MIAPKFVTLWGMILTVTKGFYSYADKILSAAGHASPAAKAA